MKIHCNLWPRFPLYRVEAGSLPAKLARRNEDGAGRNQQQSGNAHDTNINRRHKSCRIRQAGLWGQTVREARFSPLGRQGFRRVRAGPARGAGVHDTASRVGVFSLQTLPFLARIRPTNAKRSQKN